MKELISSNDVVFLSFTQDLLYQEGIEFTLLDQNMSLMEGSVGILPRRLMVDEDSFDQASALLEESLAEIESSSNDNTDDANIDLSLENDFSVSQGEDVTDDEFLGGALKIYQSKSGFRSGIDAVLLAASVPSSVPSSLQASNTIRVLEAGCGAGVVSLAVAKRNDGAFVEGIEIEQVNVDLAQKNILRNGLKERVQVHLGDLCDPITKLEILGLKRNSYDFVIANPPFYNEGETRVSSNPLRLRARRALVDDLENWVRFMTAMAAPKGVFSMIHRAERLDDLFKLLNGRFGGLRVLPIYPKANAAANRVLIQGVKGSRAPLKLLPGLTLHDESGGYVPEIKALCESLGAAEGPLAGLFL